MLLDIFTQEVEDTAARLAEAQACAAAQQEELRAALAAAREDGTAAREEAAGLRASLTEAGEAAATRDFEHSRLEDRAQALDQVLPRRTRH